MSSASIFPPWLKKTLLSAETVYRTYDAIKDAGANTVCEASQCPNLNECFSKGHATFLILGSVCTRPCGFCAAVCGQPLPPDPREGFRILKVVKSLAIDYVIITSVTRDDLPDGGAAHYGDVIETLRAYNERLQIELLIPDFKGMRRSIEFVASYSPDIFGHNIETVPRLYREVRPAADYNRSLDVLRWAKESRPGLVTKSAILLGFGEETDEVTECMKGLRSVGCDILNIGQYLRPSGRQISVKRFVEPAEFKDLEDIGYGMGFKSVSSGPFVRSSYNQKEVLRTW